MLKGRIISSVRNWEVYDSPTIKWTKDGFASLDEGRAPRRLSGAWMATAVAVLLLLGGVFLAVQGTGSGPSDLETAGGVPRSRERVTTTTAATSTTGDPAAIDPTGASTTIAGTPPTTLKPGSTPPTTVAPGATTPTTKPVPPTTVPVAITSASASATAVECGGSVTVTVHTSGSPEKVRVVSTAGTRTLSGGDGTYTGSVGPFNANGPQTLVAQAYANGKIVSTKNVSVRVSGCDAPTPASSTTQPPITGNNT
jgi:hypothetical protein